MAPTREDIHRAIAIHVRNWVGIHFVPPAADRGPAHTRTSTGWELRLSPSEADRAADAALRALEELGLITPAAPPGLEQQVHDVLTAAGHEPASEANDFGFLLRPPLDGSAHVLVLCDPTEWWRAMPGQAVRTAVSRHLTTYATALYAAGFGVVAWGRGDQNEVLIVAANQDSANEQAPTIRARLAERNPETPGGA